MTKPTRLARNIDRIRLIHKGTPTFRREAVRLADEDFIKCLSDCAINIKCKNVPLTDREWERLKRHVDVLEKLANPARSVRSKRRDIVQRGGGFLPLLIAPVLSMLASLVTD